MLYTINVYHFVNYTSLKQGKCYVHLPVRLKVPLTKTFLILDLRYFLLTPFPGFSLLLPTVFFLTNLFNTQIEVFNKFWLINVLFESYSYSFDQDI